MKKLSEKSNTKNKEKNRINDGVDENNTGQNSSVCRKARILPLCGSNSF